MAGSPARRDRRASEDVLVAEMGGRDVGRLELRPLGAEAYASWFEANRTALSHRSPFHDPAWLSAASRGVGFDLAFIGAFERTELVAAVPGFLARRGPLRLFGSPLKGMMTSYLGPVILDPALADETGHRELAQACGVFARRQWRVSYVQLTMRDAPDASRKTPMGKAWHQKSGRSYRLDLTPGEETLFAQLKSSCRRNVRRAAREGIEIVPLTDAEAFYRILQSTFRRHDSRSWHRVGFFETIMQELPRRDLLWSWGARYRGDIIAVGLFLHDDREMHYISGGSLPQYGRLPTSYLLHWHAISTAVRAGLQVFNSEASGIRSIDQFKETFNPVLARRATLIWASPVVWKARNTFLAWHKGLRRLRGRLPGGP